MAGTVHKMWNFRDFVSQSSPHCPRFLTYLVCTNNKDENQ